MNKLYGRSIALLIAFAFETGLCSTEHYETADFKHVLDRVLIEVEVHTAGRVLLVVDIDNTLLSMNQDLGSDAWFVWQESLLKTCPSSKDLVASDFQGLLDVQGTLFSLSAMHPPEPKLPGMIATIQETGCKVLVLTSRGPDFRGATERELKKNYDEFSAKHLSTDPTCQGRFLPFNENMSERRGLTAQEIVSMGSIREISYENGILMVSGQHKGYLLRAFLSMVQEREFCSIIFVDDHKKHTDRMQEAFRERDIDLVTFRYSREDGIVSRFQSSDKRHVVRNWKRLKGTLSGIFDR